MTPSTWTDASGRTHPTIRSRRPLKFGKCASQRALRLFVYARDGYRCRACGATAKEIPTGYEGWDCLSTGLKGPLVLDHIVSIRNGGSHHPDNLQVLCDSCNARKSGLVDARAGRSG